MRNELTYIQLIEKYLLNKLSDKEKQEFETRLKTDNQLKLDVEKQKLVMAGAKRMELKASAQKGFKKFKTMKNLKYIATTIAVIGAATMLYFAMSNKEVKTNSPEELLPEQGFVIDNAKDTVIETENGMVLVIPENAFVDENGNAITNVNFEVKEAFETADILKAGLTTLSDGRLLETGGMFFLNAYDKEGNKLALAKDKKILAEIPNMNPREDMMLFDGEKQEDGSINWVNPKPFEKDLITYDITTLDFYPEGYLEELKTKNSKVLVEAEGEIPTRRMTNEEAKMLGFRDPKEVMSEEEAVELGLIVRKYDDVKALSNINTNDKQFTDSLYYSFARLFEMKKEVNNTMSVKESNDNTQAMVDTNYSINYDDVNRIYVLNALSGSNVYDVNNDKVFSDSVADTLGYYEPTEEALNCTPKGINPARIQAIWNKEFNNTILATKEFERRLRVIHQTHNDALLNVYVSNINKPLWYCDSVASTMAGSYQSQFEAFYKQKKGGVKVSDKLTAKLSKYYEKKQREVTEKSAKAYQEFEAKKQKLINDFSSKKTEKDKEEFNRKMKVFNEELVINLDEAYRQIGKKRAGGVGSPFVASVGLGPKNLDAYVFESTANRTTLDYTDPETGKKAVIKYEEASVKVLNTEKFDRIFVYMIPDTLSSFNRMKTTDNINFKNTLNEFFNYKMVCLGYVGEQAYYYESDLEAKHYEVTLTKISEEELKQKLNKNKSTTKKDIIADVDFYKEEVAYNKEFKKIEEQIEITKKIGLFLFPSLEKWCFESRNTN